MERIKFRIIKESDNMCRIVAKDIRSIYKNISDGACICSLDVMLAEMERITKEVTNYGNEAMFIFD